MGTSWCEGPDERALEEFEMQGLVVGAFGEVSRNVEALEAHRCRDFTTVKGRRRSVVSGGDGGCVVQGSAEPGQRGSARIGSVEVQAPSGHVALADAWERRWQAYYKRW